MLLQSRAEGKGPMARIEALPNVVQDFEERSIAMLGGEEKEAEGECPQLVQLGVVSVDFHGSTTSSNLSLLRLR